MSSILNTGVSRRSVLAGAGGGDARTEALARDLHHAEVAHREQLCHCAVLAEFLLERVVEPAAVAVEPHVDEVDADDAAEVAQAELLGDLAGGLQVDIE